MRRTGATAAPCAAGRVVAIDLPFSVAAACSRRVAALMFGLFWLVSVAAAPGQAAPLTAGWAEPVRIVEAAVDLRAKLDTGAEHSSLHAEQLFIRHSNGATWARFLVTGASGRPVPLERRVVRQARIKRHDGRSQTRPVVRLTLCVGGLQREVDVNLVDRSGFEFPLLLGRSFLRGLVLVDADRQYLTEAACPH